MGLGLNSFKYPRNVYLSYDASISNPSQTILTIGVTSDAGSQYAYLSFAVVVVSVDSYGVELLNF
jgi:hypothetical protein